ncbi:MAG: glycosyl hydrolase [Gemmatimonadetes bacterium]|nr:glycosyl hydrolase [Gemmatimonadota bacterium]
MRRLVYSSLLSLLALGLGTPPSTAPAAAQEAPAVDPALYAGMRYRMVGPFRGGRVTAVAGIPDEPNTFFFGSTGGGVWKTDDAGQHWRPLTDTFLTAGAVGAVAVAPSDPNVIYVGTGSACIRGNISVGKGVWRSTDGGDTWVHVGLPKSGEIGSIVVDPRDPDLVYVAALGDPFGDNPERGVYRSRDGGRTWEKALFLNDSTGAVSLAMDPSNPRVIYAGMWRAERKPWTLISGGPEGGVYKTTDGGDHWVKLGGGLPQGIVGKVTVTVSGGNPQRVWAMVEAKPGNGLYRSDDGGATWTFLNGDDSIAGRPFYFHHVVADPVDANTVYVMNTRFYRSVDGGRTFRQIPVHHGDVHALWINPRDPDLFVVGDDGGAEVSLNGGRTTSTVYNQPTAEMYDVEVDNGDPYRIYGSQQDNTTISVPVHRTNDALRPQEEWRYAAGCEVGPVALDPDHPDVVWGGCYGGVINRMDISRDTRRNVNVYPESQDRAPRALRDRWQWVAPIVVDPLHPTTVYQASQYLYRTDDGGMSWKRISPDLTTDDTVQQRLPGGPIHSDNTGVEVYNTIFAVAPSPHTEGTIWVGSDDGLVHLTRDGGATWKDVTPPGMPHDATVNRIEVSPETAGRVYVAAQRYRLDDWHPYVFRTDDYGAHWQLLTDGTNGIPADHPVRVIREDDVVPGLLYAGTEFGAYVSFDDGARWQTLQLNLPATPVTDMKVHRGDLVLATQGRSFWVLDDLTPLRELALAVRKGAPVPGPVQLFTPRDVARGRADSPPLQEVDRIVPDPLPVGALLSWTVRSPVKGLTLEVLDAQGDTAAEWNTAPDHGGRAGARAGESRSRALPDGIGFHRLAWPLRYLRSGGVKAPPGIYTARLSWDGGSTERTFKVLPDPKDPGITQPDYQEQYRVTLDVWRSSQAVRAAAARIRSARTQARALVARARAAGRDTGRLDELGDSLDRRLVPLEARLTSMPDGEGGSTEAGLQQEYGTLLYYLNSGGGYGGGSTEGRPTRGAMDRKRDLDAAWATLGSEVDAALRQSVSAFNAEVKRLGLEGIVLAGG